MIVSSEVRHQVETRGGHVALSSWLLVSWRFPWKDVCEEFLVLNIVFYLIHP